MKTLENTPASEYFHRLAAVLERNSIEEVLQGLAEFFGVDGIALTEAKAAQPDVSYWLRGEPPVSRPWQNHQGLRSRLGISLAAEKHEDGAGEWLISEVWEPGAASPHYFWAFRAAKRGWRESDAWAWQMAGQAVVRRCFPPALDGLSNAELRRRLDQAAAVTGRLTHDFGNYLTGVMGFTELSMSQLAPDSAPLGFLREVLQAAKQGAEWIHRLHLFCRATAGPAWPTKLSNVVAEEEARLRGAGGSGFRWISELPDDLPLIALDAESVRVALGELVKNTREASKDEGTIRMTARVVELSAVECRGLLGAAAPGRFVELTVADDGPGITDECRAKLFRELFFSTKSKHRGLGFLVLLGILQRCGGGMRIGAAEAGKGTQVQLFLPVVVIEAPPQSAGDAPRLLLVQTDAHLSESMRVVLESAGFRVDVAASFPQAFSICAATKKSFDLIVSQSQFPQGSGFDLARRILDRDPEAKFVFVLAQPFSQGMVDVEMLNRFPMIRWPTDPKNFLQAVRAALAATEKASADDE